MENKNQNDVDSSDNRMSFVSEMKKFIEKECAEIGELLDHMSWTPDHVLKSRPMAQCPHDPCHHVPETSLKQHASACQLRKLGILDEDLSLQLQNDDFFYKNAELVGKVQLDEGLLNRIIWNHCMENRQVHMGHRSMPVGTNDWSVKLTPQERLAVYDYCVRILKEQGKMANVDQDEVLTTDWERVIKKGLLDQEKPKSKVELLAMLRDQKRRRQTYRAKNVHITKKSYTEIIREVILNQMEIMMSSQDTSKDTEQTSRQQDARCNQERQSEAGSRVSSPSSSSRGYSRHRSRSHSPRRKRKRSCSPRRRKSRSRSPRKSSSGSSRHRRDYNREDSPDDTRGGSSAKPPYQYEEGEIGSSDYSYESQVRQNSRKKSSKHKKHKHKKHKSKLSLSDSDDA